MGLGVIKQSIVLVTVQLNVLSEAYLESDR